MAVEGAGAGSSRMMRRISSMPAPVVFAARSAVPRPATWKKMSRVRPSPSCRLIGRALGADATQNITFTSTSIERTGEHTARISGDLTDNDDLKREGKRDEAAGKVKDVIGDAKP